MSSLLEYVISYKTKFGSISAQSKRPDDLLVGYQTLKQLASKLDLNAKSAPSRKASQRVRRSRFQRRKSSSRGQGETTIILRELETRLLPTAFFSKQRSTGETKEKLDAAARRDFTSRKVSQALGILWKKGSLKRSGSRNFYTYSKA